MHTLFYISGAVAVAATVMAITRLNAVHALLYLVVSLLAVSIVFYTLGAPFVAALEVIVYAGAIMVLFIFVVMMLNLGPRAVEMERSWLSPGMWVGPSILAAILIAEVAYLVAGAAAPDTGIIVVGPKQVGIVLFGPYLIGVELASMLLLGGLVGAWHLASRRAGFGPRGGSAPQENSHGYSTDERRPAAGGDPVRAGNDRPAGAP
jgi:NADH-quinone oxidoreductase subunit J